MSLLYPDAPDVEQLIYEVGIGLVKEAEADSPSLSYGLAGRLYLSSSGWILLSVPNAFVRGAFDALDEQGVELPPSKNGIFNAHISVIRPDEMEEAGIDPEKVTERGHVFHYTLGPVKTVVPHGWDDMSKVWFVEVNSPELQNLRKSYGLTALPKNNEFKFHITLAVRRKSVLRENDIAKAAEDAKGIPDKRYYGDLSKVQPGQVLEYFIQRHLAERAGPHFDVRFGDPSGLYSWATRKSMPSPGGRIAMFQQPMHSYKYKDFSGTIPSGQYGAGRVQQHHAGQLLFTKVAPNAIHFTTADKRHPERFALIQPPNWKDKSWLLINKTPTQSLPYQKVRYKKIPTEQVDTFIQQMQKGDSIEAKIDGASSLVQLLQGGVEVLSYRQSKETGRPIIHTERFFHGLPNLDIPKEMVGTVLRGEIYGVRDGDSAGQVRGGDLQQSQGGKRPHGVIDPQELGGLLNSTLAKSITTQREKGISLRNMVYDIQQLGKTPVDANTVSREERRRMIEHVLKYLNKDKFHISEAANDPESGKRLWNDVREGKHGLTGEGVVMWPHSGPPMKSKIVDDSDVHVTGVFPGENRLANTGIGGFTYSLKPGGPTVGRVGTGLSDELRQAAFADPESYVGRVARIRSQEQFPSGAHRAPALLALHEDLPHAKVKKAEEQVEVGCSFSDMVELGIIKVGERFFIGEALGSRLGQPLMWNNQQSPLNNMAGFVSGVASDAQTKIDQAYGAERIREVFQPDNEVDHDLLQVENENQEPIVTNEYDKMLQMMNPYFA